jgi:hypothetical protein
MLLIRRTHDGFRLDHMSDDKQKTMTLPASAKDDVRRLALSYGCVFEDTDRKSATYAPLHLDNSIDIGYYDAVTELCMSKQDIRQLSDAAKLACKHMTHASSDQIEASFRSTNQTSPAFYGSKTMKDVQHHSGGLNYRGACSDISCCSSKTTKGANMLQSVRMAADATRASIKNGSDIDTIQEDFVSRLSVIMKKPIDEVREQVPFAVINRVGTERFVNGASGMLLSDHVVSFGPNFKIDDEQYILERQPLLVQYDGAHDLTDGLFKTLQRP